jgi:nicotinamidase-related amidase
MAEIPIDPKRSALIIFDMMQHYVYPKDPDKARQIAEKRVVENTARLLRACRAAGVAVFYTNGDHRADGADWIPSITDADMDLNPWPGGPREMPRGGGVTAGSPGQEMPPELAPEPSDFVILKKRWSSFAGTPLDVILRNKGIDTLLITGGSTDVGVGATAFAARDLGYQLIVLRDCTHSERPGAQDFFMNRLLPRMGRVMDADAAIALMKSG